MSQKSRRLNIAESAVFLNNWVALTNAWTIRRKTRLNKVNLANTQSINQKQPFATFFKTELVWKTENAQVWRKLDTTILNNKSSNYVRYWVRHETKVRDSQQKNFTRQQKILLECEISFCCLSSFSSTFCQKIIFFLEKKFDRAELIRSGLKCLLTSWQETN